MITIRVKGSTKIEPFPLFPHLLRESLMKEAKEFCLVHIPPEPGILGRPKVAVGLKYTKETANKGHCKL